MTEQEQKAFTAMREALESSAVCIQLMSDGPSRASWGDTLDIIDAALAAANAVSVGEPTGHDGKGCNEVLRLAGRAYPRTCKACGLGPCNWKAAANAVQPQAQWEAHDFQNGYDTGYEAGVLHATQATEPAGWKPIETAPKDGPVLLWGLWAGEISGKRAEPCAEIGYYSGGGDYAADGYVWAATGGDAYGVWCKPTHWMPLPAAPEAS